MVVFLLLYFPYSTKSTWSYLIKKLIIISSLFFDLDGLCFKGSGKIWMIVGVEGGWISILLDWFFTGFIFGCGYCHFIVFEGGLVVFGTDENAGGFGDIHIECEFEIDFIVFLVDFEEEVSSWWIFLLLLLYLFKHFLFIFNIILNLRI